MMETWIGMMQVGAMSVVSLFFGIWLIYLVCKNAGIVDVGWGLGFMILCGIYIVMGEGWTLRNVVLMIMVGLWGMRIVLFLLKRLMHDQEEDRRYQQIRRDWGKHIDLKFMLFFQFQACLELVLALPFMLVAVNPSPGLSWIEWMGVVVFVLALAGELLADEQLHAFKAEPKNKGKTCDVGFWYYSRHPNYFFEWMVWVGIFIFALPSPHGWLSVMAPAIMYYLMRYVSGVPMAEQQAIKSRGQNYRQYQATTSVFFPMPKKGV